MPKGYIIVVRDYVAEIVEFQTIEVIRMPDDDKVFHIITKYGEDYVKEGQIKPIRKMLEKECEELNKALEKSRGVHERSGYKNL